MDEDIKKQCGNCRYFLIHYIKRDRSFKTTTCGHCIYKNITNKKMSLSAFKEACPHWEFYENKEDVFEVHITNILDDVYKKLHSLSEYFEN